MPYSFHEHTADIRMNVSGKTLEDLFRDALLGMVYFMDPGKVKGDRAVKQEITVEARDTTELIVDFLNEALSRMYVEHDVYTGVCFRSINERSLKAELEGYKVESFDKDIKAVTYHEADVKINSNGEWNTTIIFDI